MKMTGSRSIELEPAKRQRTDPPAAADTVAFTKMNDQPTGNTNNITINLEGGTMHGPLSLFSSNTLTVNLRNLSLGIPTLYFPVEM